MNKRKLRELENDLKEAISNKLFIPSSLLAIKVIKGKIGIKGLNFNIHFSLNAYTENEVKSQQLKDSFNDKKLYYRDNSLLLNIGEEIFLHSKYRIQDCFNDMESIEHFFYENIHKNIEKSQSSFVKIADNFVSILKEEDSNNSSYVYEKRLSFNYQETIESIVNKTIVNCLLKKHFLEEKKLELTTEDLKYIVERFDKTESVIYFDDEHTILKTTREFEQYLDFKDREGLNEINEFLILNYQF
jgi:hypothetical protein